MRYAPLLLLAAVAAGIGAAPAPAQIYTFSQGERNGVCYVAFPAGTLPGSDTPASLEFSYRVRDGNFGASVKVNGWPRAQEADPDATLAMTLEFDTGGKTTSRSGGYSSGFNDIAWGGWGAGAGSDGAFAMLEQATTATVRFDGLEIGPVQLHKKGLAHISLSMCRDDLAAGSE